MPISSRANVRLTKTGYRPPPRSMEEIVYQDEAPAGPRITRLAPPGALQEQRTHLGSSSSRNRLEVVNAERRPSSSPSMNQTRTLFSERNVSRFESLNRG